MGWSSMMRIRYLAVVVLGFSAGAIAGSPWVFACTCPDQCVSFTPLGVFETSGSSNQPFFDESRMQGLVSVPCGSTTISVPDSWVRYQDTTIDCNSSNPLREDRDRYVVYERQIDYGGANTPSTTLNWLWQCTLDAKFDGWRYLCCGSGSVGDALRVEAFARVEYEAGNSNCSSYDQDPDSGTDWSSLGWYQLVLTATGNCTSPSGNADPAPVTLVTAHQKACSADCKSKHINRIVIRFAVTNPGLHLNGSGDLQVTQTADSITCQ